MRRLLPILLGIAMLVLLAACSGDDGAVGPQGATGPGGQDAKPGPFKLWIGGQFPETLADNIVLSGVFAPGMEIATMNVQNETPTLADISPYDVVLVYTSGSLDDQTALGDVLADYIDGGGKVVTGMYVYRATTQAITGRFVDSPYMPAIPSNTAGTWGNFDVSSISSPPHPIFYGIGVADFPFWFNANYVVPGVQAWGTVLATDTNGNPMVIINDDETVISVVMYPWYQFDPAGSDGARILIRNALAYLAGKLD